MKVFLSMMSISILYIIVWVGDIFAANIPDIECWWLPGCDGWVTSESGIYDIVWNTIALLIQYVAVFAVLAVMYGGILYLISSWDEEKTKKAKTVIIWALVGTFLSVSAWTLISIINRIVI